MANPTILDNDVNEVALGGNEFEDKTILLGETVIKGQVLGQVTAAATSITADVGNTGDGTFTALALAAGGPAKPGAWSIECIEAVTNGGIFKLTDPDGIIVANDITIAAGAGGIITPIVAGITFTITDATTDFIVGDNADIVIGSGTGKLKEVNAANVDGSQIPLFISTVAVTTTADAVTRVLKTGLVRKLMLAFNGSETVATVVNGKSYQEWLRDVGIVVVTDIVNDRINPS